MIISASYRTDIPAFYGEWFMNRLDAGYCLVENPYSGQPYRVSLRREDVDGFVFWTKNLTPFMGSLKPIRVRGFPFVVQYSINAYPRQLEFSVVDAERAVAQMRQVAVDYGERVPVWRYDPILFTSLTPPDFHRENFARLAAALAGSTDEVVISFAQIYQKTRRNLSWAAREFDFTWDDPPDATKLELVSELTAIARQHGMQLTVCSQRQYIVPGVEAARCIDARRLADIAGKVINVPLKGNRPDCACHLSRDIGAYDTCPHGCVYCYAVRERALALSRYREHNPTGDFLYRVEQSEAEPEIQPRLL
ncbi:MAG: DUF1848 domain-containing protein [Anaerolineaceae bacterium]|nr:DUF1848 domain-containing protein [Anaerolineaceae bacterium]